MAETYSGEVRNGVVVFDEGTPPLPEGMRVRLEIEAVPEPEEVRMVTAGDGAARTRAWLLAMAREAEAHAPPLPRDLAEHHDHYAHGKPRP